MKSSVYGLYLPFDLFQANIGIAELLALAMQEEGMSKEDALSRIWMVDSRGLLVKVCVVVLTAKNKNMVDLLDAQW